MKKSINYTFEQKEKERTFKAEESNIKTALDFIKDELQKVETSQKTYRQIIVCIEEIFSNVCHYAYKEEKGNITVKFAFDDKRYKITVIDSGVEFNPLLHTDPNVTLAPKDRQIGGLGIFMVKNIMDKVDYVRYDNQNVFTMEKNI